MSATIHTQHCSSALMELADNPYRVEGVRTHRVPIFMTSNDLTTMYGGLTRTGRMWVFPWSPVGEEREGIVRHILAELLEPEHMKQVLAMGATWPLSHFGHLKSLLEQRLVFESCNGTPAAEVIQRLLEPVPPDDGGRYRQATKAELDDAISELQSERVAVDRCANSHKGDRR